jgi:hypothetical protein
MAIEYVLLRIERYFRLAPCFTACLIICHCFPFFILQASQVKISLLKKNFCLLKKKISLLESWVSLTAKFCHHPSMHFKCNANHQIIKSSQFFSFSRSKKLLLPTPQNKFLIVRLFALGLHCNGRRHNLRLCLAE